MADQQTVEAGASPGIGYARLAIGLVQGWLIYALLPTGPLHGLVQHLPPYGLAAIFAGLGLPPIVLIVSLGAFRTAVIAAWTATSVALASGLVGYGVWRLGASHQAVQSDFTAGPVVLALVFILHHLLEASVLDRRFVARYPSYFDPAWKHAVQLALSAAFSVVFWGLLWVGAGLFLLLNIHVLADLLPKLWFAGPASAGAFAAALHLTDVRPELVKGVRTVALTLLSWLSPLLLLLAGAFVITLPFTGLDPPWKTKAAAASLLGAASLMILLINAAYQDGTERPAAVLRWTVRAATGVVLVLVGLAWVGIGLRLRAYGLTPERVFAIAWAVIASGYALGYLLAALRAEPWMKPLERTNVGVAWLTVFLILMLFTPIADAYRLSVADQIRRLDSGAIDAAQFDYNFLRFRSGRFGTEALNRLAGRTGGGRDALIAKKAKDAKTFEFSGPFVRPQKLSAPDRAARLDVYPKGASLPDSFLAQEWSGDYTIPPCLTGISPQHCDAIVMDMDGDGAPEILVANGDIWAIPVFKANAAGGWSHVANIPTNNCSGVIEWLKAGRATTAPPAQLRDLVVSGIVFPTSAVNQTPNKCPGLPDAAAPGVKSKR